MYRIIQNRKIYYIISGILLVPGLVFLFAFQIKLGIDFTGGSLIEYTRNAGFDRKQVSTITSKVVSGGHQIQLIGSNKVQIKLPALSQDQHEQLSKEIIAAYADANEVSFSNIGPSIGKELQQKSIYAILLVFTMIVLYISWSFKKASSWPITPWVYGFSAVIALFHDLLMVVGIFAILSKLFNVEIDSMFVTALLTVLGFSVHDTIVVFDRIRERVRTFGIKEGFENVANISIQQTIVRSLATSFTAVLTLLTLLLFGGESIRYFILALTIGIISGTYSSIFVASPLLVTWYNYKMRKRQSR